MKKALGIAAILVIYYLMMAYLIGMFSGATAQDAWTQLMAGKSPKIEIQTDPASALSNIFHNPAALKIWLGISTVLLLIIGLFLLAYKDEVKKQFGREVPTDEKNTYGSADWMKESEAKKVFKFGVQQKGILLGKVNGERVVLPEDTKYNKHIAIFGAPGTGKSRTFARPNIIQIVKMGQSMIITDPKGELFEDMSVWLEQQGYDVKALNLVNIEYSDRWNPLDAVVDDMDATVFADVVIRNTQIGVKKGGDPFWDRAELNLLKALVLYVKETRPINQQNLGEVYKLLANGSMQSLQMLFAHLPNNRASKMAYNIFAQANQNVQTGVIIGLGTRLQVFQNELVQKMTEMSDIDLEAPKRRKVAYFCIMSDTHSAFDFISSLFFSFLFIKLVNLHDTTTKTEIRSREVYFILDEFPNIGEIPDFTKKISTIRSRRLHCSIIFQSISQLENRYPNNQWEEILGSCDTKYFLGCNDTRTAEYISDVLGIKSIHTSSQSRKGGLEGITEIERITQSVGKRQLLTPDEVARLDNKNAIVILRGQKPLLVEKVDISEIKESKQLTIRPIKEYTRQWASFGMLQQSGVMVNTGQPAGISNPATTGSTPAATRTVTQQQPTINPQPNIQTNPQPNIQPNPQPNNQSNNQSNNQPTNNQSPAGGNNEDDDDELL